MTTEPLHLRAWRDDHYVSLAEIMLGLGYTILNFRWSLKLDEVAPEPAAKILESLDVEKRLTTMELLHFVTPTVQIIDGKILGYDTTGEKRIVITAVDSTWWDVETDSIEIKEAVRLHFRDPLIEE